MEGIIPRTSLLDLDVRVSQHPAPDNLGKAFLLPCFTALNDRIYNRNVLHPRVR